MKTLLFLSVFTVFLLPFNLSLFATETDLAKMNFTFSELPMESGEVQMDLSFQFPPNTICLQLFSEPSHTLLVLIQQDGVDLPKELSACATSPLFHASSNLLDDKIQSLLPLLNSEDTFFTGYINSLSNGILIENRFMEVHSNSLNNISFSIGFESDDTGCMTIGQCSNGPRFFGPYCNPCFYTICCYGDYGYILCGLVPCQ